MSRAIFKQHAPTHWTLKATKKGGPLVYILLTVSVKLYYKMKYILDNRVSNKV